MFASYVARLSKDAWVEWAKSTESDEDLLIILDPIINEIEDRMHEKLEVFQASFFGSLGAASKKIDEATGQSTIKSDNQGKPHHGVCCGSLDEATGARWAAKRPKTAQNKGLISPKQALNWGWSRV